MSYHSCLNAAGKQHSLRFSLNYYNLKTHTTVVQTMSGPKTLETQEWGACNCTGLRALEAERNSAAVCAKRSFTEAQEDGYSWHSHLCSAARRWGRHTVNCRQNRKAESCEICILTATVHKSVKSHCHTRWYTKNQEKVRERIYEGSLTLVQTGGRQKLREKTFLISELAVSHISPATSFSGHSELELK